MAEPHLKQPQSSFEADAKLSNLLQEIYTLAPPGVNLGLSRVEALLAHLGNPHHRLPPIIHVAGSNGKGSVIAFMNAILQAAGKRVHVYTSPHLLRFHERIQLANTLIDDEQLLDCLGRVRDALCHTPGTYFEVITAAAFLAFSETPADFLLLETGLGGRLDATNVVADPAACVITALSLEHKEFLGDTLAAIAGEKAGIIKPGCPVVIGPQPAEALAALKQKAKAENAALIETTPLSADRMNSLGLQGPHQLENAGLAIAALEEVLRQILGDTLTDTQVQQGLAQARWPGRLQKLEALSTPEHPVILDGAHNPAAFKVLAESLRALYPAPYRLILGIRRTKDVTGCLKALTALGSDLEVIQVVPVPDEEMGVDGMDPHSADPQEVAKLALDLGFRAQALKSAEDALHQLSNHQEKANPQATTAICGSLYLAGAVLKRLA